MSRRGRALLRSLRSRAQTPRLRPATRLEGCACPPGLPSSADDLCDVCRAAAGAWVRRVVDAQPAVRTLRYVLEQAERGELTGVAIVAACTDGGVATCWEGRPVSDLVYGVEILRPRLLAAGYETDDDEDA